MASKYAKKAKPAKFYAVAVGRSVGIFRHWSEAQRSVDRFSGHCHQDFESLQDAETFMRRNGIDYDRSMPRYPSQTYAQVTAPPHQGAPVPDNVIPVDPSSDRSLSNHDSTNHSASNMAPTNDQLPSHERDSHRRNLQESQYDSNSRTPQRPRRKPRDSDPR